MTAVINTKKIDLNGLITLPSNFYFKFILLVRIDKKKERGNIILVAVSLRFLTARYWFFFQSKTVGIGYSKSVSVKVLL